MYLNYIFDLYGTLVNIHTDENSLYLFEKLSLFYSFNGAFYTSTNLKKEYLLLVDKYLSSSNIDYPDFDILDIFRELYINKNIIPSKDLINDTAQIFRILSIEKLELYSGTIDLLMNLKSNNKKIFLLTNAQRAFTLFELDFLGIKNYFDEIFYSSDYKISKPSQDFYKALLNKHNLDIGDTIMIGNDYFCDIIPANNLNIDTLYIHSNISPIIDSEINSTYKILDGDVKKIKEFILK